MVTYRLRKQLISLQIPNATKKEIDFTDTSFFTTSPNRHLPTPAQVRALSKDIDTRPQPTPIIFENLNLIAKFGLYVTIVEALNLWVIKKVFHDKVPVPELFGWRVEEEGYVFIYTELIEGPTLEECWDRLTTMEKSAVSDQLSQIMETMRQLQPDPSDQFIGSINRECLLDYVFLNQLITGPFPNIKEFNDWFTYPNHGLLPDNGDIKFTHAELERRNIIVSSFTPVQIVIVNWQQAGWYPDYWEYCKAFYTFLHGKWRKNYVDKFLQPRTDVYTAFSVYCMAMGTD
ncbi:hypothetical protein BDV41DRAFT_573399 [Aspergillus transmontanensis]|uniref:Aminoglycoside phosphotransferase domain-containing protein n=1 Tax=Aspergillus transmontanensis TaxID=1034304 RepID=A0A5N6W8N9_9EURO|nr:hypothetical protein BDV41DRAFT_573399 [Aspergillus transmontanensis]